MWIYEKEIVEKFSIRRRKRRKAMDEWLKTRDLPLHFISVERMGNPWRSGRTGRGYNEWLKKRNI